MQSSTEALVALRSARRRNRIANLDKFDAFYKAYVAGILSAIAIYSLAGWLGDAPVVGSGLITVRNDGPAYLGIVAALVFAVGLRSGGRGGPLAFEHADVRHVLLAPVDTKDSIRGPALRAIRHAAFLGSAVGAAIGIIALRRLPDVPVAWVLCGALFGATIAVFAMGIAMIFSGCRLPTWLADVFVVGVVSWAGADAYWHMTTSPFTWLGHVALWPMHIDLLGILGLAIVALVALVGLAVVKGISIEAAERRSKLIGQLRFAATLQDVRTVMVLQRQLAQERVRQTARFKLPPIKNAIRRGRPVVSVFIRRCLQDFLRWPFFRFVRLTLFVAISALCTWGVWAGTTALIVPAGLALWIASLDLLEPLAQETDHPDRGSSFVHDPGWIYSRLLIVPGGVLFGLLLIASVPAVVFGDPDLISSLWILLPLVTALSLGGAAIAVSRPPNALTGAVPMPEIAGVQFFLRALLPPALSVLGFVPLAVAQNSWAEKHSIELMLQTMNLPMAITLACASWSIAWVRYGTAMREKMTGMGARAVAGPEAVKK